MGAADLENVLKRLSFVLECLVKPGERWVEPIGDFLGCGSDRLRQPLFDEADFAIGGGCRLLDQGDRPDQGFRHIFLADPEIPARALGLRAPIAVVRHLDLAKGIGLDARGSWGPAHGTSVLRHAHFSCRRHSASGTLYSGPAGAECPTGPMGATL